MKTKQLMAASVFAVALVASIGLGLASRQYLHAAVIRDNDPVNSVDGCNFNGGIGAANPQELIADARDNCKGDLQTIYGHFGLTPDKYDQFAREAQEGVIFRDGHIEVNRQTVMTNVKTMGRTTLGLPASVRTPVQIGNTTLYSSAPSASFAKGVNSLPVMVWFDQNGEVIAAILDPCGNTTEGTKVHNSVTCQALNATQPDKSGKPNTWNFTTNATVGGNAVISRVVYTFSDDNSVVTKTGADAASQVVEHTFQQDGKVTVTVFAAVPGNHEIQAIAVVNCQKEIKFVPPFFECSALVATAVDQRKRTFRFTVKVNMDANTKLKDADFTLDGTSTTTGVTTMDDKDNIFKEYTFDLDGKTHTVSAKVNFTTAAGVSSKSCEAQVTSGTMPPQECKPGIPVGDQRCNECKPGVPFGSPQCNEQPPLVNTGISAGSSISLFGATVVVGFFGHRLFMSRRARRMLSDIQQ